MKKQRKPSPNENVNKTNDINMVVGAAQTSGRRLRVTGHREAARAVSDLLTLPNYSEVEFVHPFGGPSTFITTEELLSNPQVFTGYREANGSPLLYSLKHTMDGHCTIIGPTRTGKSHIHSVLAYQLSRLGHPKVDISLKSFG